MRTVDEAMAVDVGEERNVAVEAEDKVDVGETVLLAKGVGEMNSALDEGDGLGVAVSASGMINGGKVGLSARVGVVVARNAVGVRKAS